MKKLTDKQIGIMIVTLTLVISISTLAFTKLLELVVNVIR